MRVFMAASPLLMLFLGFTMLSGEHLPRMFVLSNYYHSVSEIMVQHKSRQKSYGTPGDFRKFHTVNCLNTAKKFMTITRVPYTFSTSLHLNLIH